MENASLSGHVYLLYRSTQINFLIMINFVNTHECTIKINNLINSHCLVATFVSFIHNTFLCNLTYAGNGYS